MSGVIYRRGDNIILLDNTHKGPTDLRIGKTPAPVTSIIVSGPTAGAYWIKLNNTTFFLYTTAQNLVSQVFIRMGVNEVSLDAVPANGNVYLTLDQTR